jgi:hypothetical protein
MRTRSHQHVVDVTKNRSRGGAMTQCVVENTCRREYFRFENGRVVEYDMTKYNSRPIKYGKEEKEGLEDHLKAEGEANAKILCLAD